MSLFKAFRALCEARASRCAFQPTARGWGPRVKLVFHRLCTAALSLALSAPAARAQSVVPLRLPAPLFEVSLELILVNALVLALLLWVTKPK